MQFFMYLFIHFISLYVPSIKCSLSGDRIVLMHHLVWLVCVTAWYAGQVPPDRHINQSLIQTSRTRWCINTIRSPDNEHLMFETCREMKWINKYMKNCIRLVINKNLWRDVRSTKYKIYFILSFALLCVTSRYAREADTCSTSWCLKLWYAYHYWYTNNWWLIGGLNKNPKYKKDKNYKKTRKNIGHKNLLTCVIADSIIWLISAVSCLSGFTIFKQFKTLNQKIQISTLDIYSITLSIVKCFSPSSSGIKYQIILHETYLALQHFNY